MSTDKLTILFLAANPEKTNRVKLDEEAHAIDDVLRRAEFRIFDLRTHWALRYGDLPELLLRYNPHIVHFSGHGSTLGDIALQDDSGKIHLVQPDALAALFRTLKDNIRCVVLNACYSQIQAEGIARSIDFVVGMNREIKDTAAINFAAGFYRGLGYGRTIQTAFDLGCIEIGLAGIVQTSTRPPVTVGEPTGTPVLGGTAAIPQLLALRSDPDKVKLDTVAANNGATESKPSEVPVSNPAPTSTTSSRPSLLMVMISSTMRDLPEHRQQVKDACLSQDMFPKMMEQLPASDAGAIAASLKMVDEADVYLGVFGWRYGFVPAGYDISITEMEYNRATERGIPRLIFLMDEDHPVKVSDVEKGPGAAKLDALKQHLSTTHVVNFFKSPEDLRAQVTNTLASLKAAPGGVAAGSGPRAAVSGSGAAAQSGGVAAGAGGVAVGGDVHGNITINQGGSGTSPSSSSTLHSSTKLTKLSGQQFGQLQKALLAAFDMGSLTQMVKIQLDETLSAIAGGGNLSSTVFELVSWAQRTGNLDRLLDGALAENPGSPELQTVNKALRG